MGKTRVKIRIYIIYAVKRKFPYSELGTWSIGVWHCHLADCQYTIYYTPEETFPVCDLKTDMHHTKNLSNMVIIPESILILHLKLIILDPRGDQCQNYKLKNASFVLEQKTSGLLIIKYRQQYKRPMNTSK